MGYKDKIPTKIDVDTLDEEKKHLLDAGKRAIATRWGLLFENPLSAPSLFGTSSLFWRER